jgi:outer membrane protein insertion porin family/translocation and assembly module TamA
MAAAAAIAAGVWGSPLAAQVLTCERGDREVRSLGFEGHREFSDETLLATVATQPSRAAGLPLVGERKCLDPLEFTRDVQRLLTLYRRRGFPDVKVDTLVTARRPGVIDVRFRITEGEPLRVTAFVLRGAERELVVADAARDFPIAVGSAFDRGALEAGRDSLVRRLRNRGWPQAEALLAWSTNSAARTAAVEVTVVPGVRAKLGAIAIRVDTSGRGGRRVSDATIRRTMALRSGDWFSVRAIIDAQRNLYQTDAFQRVDVQPDSVQPPGDSLVNLVANLVEGDRFAARGGVGWATLDCFRMQGSLTDRDFVPYAQRMELTARVSKIGIGAPFDGAPSLCQGQARSDPYSATLNYYTAFSVRQPVRAGQTRVPTLTIFSSTLSEFKAFLRRTPIGASVSMTNPLFARYPSALSYQVELGRTEAEPAFFCAVFNACDAEARTFLQRNNRLAALEFSASRERVNDPLRPSRGTTVRLTARHASTYIGSDRSQQFNRVTGDATWFTQLPRGATLTAHVRGGMVFGAGQSLLQNAFIPPQERLYAGGPTTVRGFRQNEMGPAVYIVGAIDTVDNGQRYLRVREVNGREQVAERVVPTGGNTLVVGNLEVQLPSPVAPRLLQLALFADGGRLWNRAGSGSARPLTDDGPTVKVTPGMGVRIVSPFGAIRIDLGYNPYALPAGAAYFNAPLQAGVAPLYCVSPGNTLRVTEGTSGAPAAQEPGVCPATFRPALGAGLLRRLNPSIWIGQAF